MSQNALDSLSERGYEVVIDSTLADGNLTYAEHVVPGHVSLTSLPTATATILLARVQHGRRMPDQDSIRGLP